MGQLSNIEMSIRLRSFIPWRVMLGSVLLFAAIAGSAACHRDPQVRKRAYAASGDKYVAQGKYAEAIVEYRNALQYDGRAGDVRLKLADAYSQTKDLPNAFQEYVRAADLLPDNDQLQVKAGNLLLLVGRYDDAKARAAQVLARLPGNVDAQILLANALAGLKQFDSAVSQIEDALRANPDRSATYANLGALELGRGNKDAAEKAFLKAVELAPTSGAARLALANFYWISGKWPETEKAIREAVRLNPNDELTLRAEASFYLATNRRAEAKAPLERMVSIANSDAARLTLVDYYLGSDEQDRAKDILEALVKARPDLTDATVRLAAIEYSSGRAAQAYARLDSILKADASNLQALLVKSRFALGDQKIEDALQLVTAATKSHPDSTAAFFLLGQVQTVRRKPDAAIVAYQEVLKLNPRATDAKVRLAQLNLVQGQPATSMAFAQEALAQTPSSGEARLVLVRALLARGEADSAERELDRLLKAFPSASAVHSQMGFLLTRKGDLKRARDEFERAAELDGSSFEALNGLVTLDIRSKDVGKAKARIESRLSTTPNDARVLTLGARVLMFSGDSMTAERYLMKAIELDAESLPSYGTLGQLYITQGRLDPAIAQFEAIAQRAPKQVAAVTMLGILRSARGDNKSAKASYERALEIDPTAAVAANNLAWLYATGDGNLDIALQLAKTAMARLSETPEVNDTLGFVYFKKDLAAQAITSFKHSAAKDPNNPMYQFHLGLAYAKAGDEIQAKRSLNRALALNSSFDGADEARSVLARLGPG